MIPARFTPGLATIGAVLLLAWCIGLAGCQPRLDPQEFGDVSDKLPKIEGADEPYPLPKLEDSVEKPEPTSAPDETPSAP